MAALGVGLTTLRADPEYLERRIAASERAFDPRVTEPGADHYLFVVEELGWGAIVGTSGLEARVGGFDPFYTYDVVTERVAHAPLGVDSGLDVLHLRRDHKGPSELCSLALRPDERTRGLGRLASLGRLLFLAGHPERFDHRVIAELRGYLDAAGQSPFWDAVGRHFFLREFDQADALSSLGDKDVIEDLMPRHPIYVAMLPEAARAVIGRVHPDTEGARHLLEQEGFAWTHEIDIFDAGPIVGAEVADIRTVRACEVLTVVAGNDVTGAPVLLANDRLDFRATAAPVGARGDGTVALDRATRAALDVVEGETVRLAPLR